jgi:transposase InsO family protein
MNDENTDFETDFEALNVHTVLTELDVFANNNDFNVNLLVQNQTVSFQIDTAARTSILNRKSYNNLHIKPELKKCTIPIRGIWGSNMPDGYIDLPVKYKGVEYSITCQVINNDVPNLLSIQDTMNMRLIKRVYAADPDYDICAKFSDVFSGIGKIPGDYTLSIDPNAPPVALNARPIPAALREATKNKLDELEKQDIIRKVPVGEPTPWCSALHVVPKRRKSDNQMVDVRITVDPRDLNKALKREFHPITSIEDVTTRTDGSKYFTCLDANQGYFQIGLDKESQKLTTFITPFGRYQYKRLPMGITSAPEIYQRAMSDMFQDLEGVEIIMDDILVHGDTREKHDQRLEKVLQRCRERNLKLNPQKTKLRQEEVVYIGHKLTKDGVKIDDQKVKAVLEMPEPTSIANVQTLLGMVTYICKFLPNLSTVTEPLRNLIKESNTEGFEFYFSEEHRKAVIQLKEMMTNAPVLRYYSQTEPITISGDASQAGLGVVLLQGGRPVAYGSKALTDTEKNYSQIEKELLAILFGLKKFHTYVYGRNDITVETDHLPLVRILDKPLHDVPLRLQKMRMALQHYSFKIVGKSGKDVPVADALSRAYLPSTDSRLLQDVNLCVFAVEVRSMNVFTPQRQDELRRETQMDKELGMLKKQIKDGWPVTRQQVPPEIRPYWDSRDGLGVIEEIIFKGDRVVIPKTMRQRVLEIVHEGHLGIVMSKQLARDSIYWPGMNSQIEDIVSKCSECQEQRRVQEKQPMIPSEIPENPWQIVAADLLYCENANFLVVIDYFSDFIEVEELPLNTHSLTVIEKLAKMFAVHGRPVKLMTDNGPQFRSHQFVKFTTAWGINHITTSPYHHQANGKVERAIQTVRHLLERSKGNRTNFYCGLLQLHNTPNPMYSPAQKLMSRRTLTKLPISEKLLQPKVVEKEEVRENIRNKQQKSAKYFNRHTRDLEPLRQEDTVRVRIQNKWKPARLIPSQPKEPRSYNLETEHGSIWRRNRRDILKTKEPSTIFQRAPEEYEHDLGERASAAPLDPPQQNPPSPVRSSPVSSPTPDPNLRPNTPLPFPSTQLGPPTHTRSGRMSKLPERFKGYKMY